MANRTIGDFARSKLRVPDYNEDLSGAALLNQVASTSARLGNEAIKEWQKAEIEKAQEEGTKEGMQAVIPSDVPFRDKSTLTAEAFNKAAMNAAAAKASANSSLEIKKLSDQYYNNPEMMEKAASSFIKGQAESMVKNPMTETLGLQLKEQLTLQKEQYLIGIRNNSMKETAAQVEKDINDSLNLLELQNQDQNGALFSEDKSVAANSFSNHGLQIKQIDMMARQRNPLTGKNYYNEAEISRIKEKVTRDYITANVIALANNPETPDEVLLDIVDGTFVGNLGTDKDGRLINIDPRYVMGSDDRYQKEIAGPVKAIMDSRNKINERMEAEAEKYHKIQQGLNYNALTMRQQSDPNSVSFTEIQKAVQQERITPSNGNELIKNIGTEPRMKSDPEALAVFNNILVNGTPEEATEFLNENAGSFTRKDLVSNHTAISKYHDLGFKAVNDNNLKAFDKIAIKSDPYGMLDQTDKISVANEMKQVYRNNVNSGMTQELAYQLMLDQWEDYSEADANKTAESFRDTYSRFMVNNPDGTLNVSASSQLVDRDQNAGDLNEQGADEAKRILLRLYNFEHPQVSDDKEGVEQIPIEVPKEEGGIWDWFSVQL